MKKLFILLLGCFILFASTSFVSAKGPYIGGKFGMGIISDSDMTCGISYDHTHNINIDNGEAFSISAGYVFNKNFRLEGEIPYQKNDLLNVTLGKKGKQKADINGNVKSLAFLANGYYDFANRTKFTPFVTAGIGVSRIEFNDKDYDVTMKDTVFAYQVGAGVSYAMTENVSLDGTYRYFGTSDPRELGVSMNYSSHNVYLGARYNF